MRTPEWCTSHTGCPSSENRSVNAPITSRTIRTMSGYSAYSGASVRRRCHARFAVVCIVMILPRLFCSLIRRSSGGNGSFRHTIQKKNGSSRKVGGANNGLGEAPKSCTRKEHESATNSIAKRGQGGTSSLFVCPLQGQGTASLVGFGATPQLFRVRPASQTHSTKAQAAKRPCQ